MANEIGASSKELDSEELEETICHWNTDGGWLDWKWCGNWVIGGVGTVVGFLIAYLIHYLPWKAEKHIEHSKRKNTKKLILTWNSVEYHIHHWVTFSFMTVLLLVGYYGGALLVFGCVGLAVGAVAEDFLFKGIFRFNVINI